MFSIFKAFTSLLCLTLYCGQSNALIPKPEKMLSQNEFAMFTIADLSYVNDNPKCFILEEAVYRLFNSFKKLHTPISEKEKSKINWDYQIKSLKVILKGECDETLSKMMPRTTMDESYVIQIFPETISIVANEVWGAVRALESVKQLVKSFGEKLLLLPLVSVRDQPRFMHRGFLVDTSRHFISMDKLKTFIDAMALVKMNVFHWHIVDDHSFPYESFTFPDLSKMGAYDPHHNIYTQSDVAEIINYSRLRGIRVMPEFDTPGHTQSWGPAIPDFLTKCYSKGKLDGNFGPIDPSYKPNYDVLYKFFHEVLSVFPDNYVHLGGDEVSFDCWKSNPQVNSFMKSKNITNYKALENYYIKQLDSLVQVTIKRHENSRRQISRVYWEEVFFNNAISNKEAVIHVWKENAMEKLKVLTTSGHRALLSNGWYLDYISYGEDWKKYYALEPTNFQATEEQKKLVLGGEACIWSEFVDDSNLISRSWPRGAPIAERLWSPKSVRDESDFRSRLSDLICFMKYNGINAEPLTGPGHCPGL